MQVERDVAAPPEAVWAVITDLERSAAVIGAIIAVERIGDATGFEVVADFSGTAHSYTGHTLPAASTDLGDVLSRPSAANAWAGYCSISRVRYSESLLIVRPFSPRLFALGPHPGPHLQMRYQRGEIPQHELEHAWAEAEATRAAADAAQTPAQPTTPGRPPADRVRRRRCRTGHPTRTDRAGCRRMFRNPRRGPPRGPPRPSRRRLGGRRAPGSRRPRWPGSC